MQETYYTTLEGYTRDNNDSREHSRHNEYERCTLSHIFQDYVQYRVRRLLDAPDVVHVTEHATYDVHQAHMGTMKQVMKQDLGTQKRAQRATVVWYTT